MVAGGLEESCECEYQARVCLSALRCEIILDSATLSGQGRDVHLSDWRRLLGNLPSTWGMDPSLLSEPLLS